MYGKVLYDIIQIFRELKEFKDQKVAYFFTGLILYDQIQNVLLPKCLSQVPPISINVIQIFLCRKLELKPFT